MVPDTLARVILWQYDLLGRVRSVISDDGAVTSHTYDGLSRVLKTFDKAGNMTENWYDDAGNVIETRRTDDNVRYFAHILEEEEFPSW